MYHLLKGRQPRKLLCSYICGDINKRSFKISLLKLMSALFSQCPVLPFPCNMVSRKRLRVPAYSESIVLDIAKPRSFSSAKTPSHAWPSGCCGGAVSLLLKDIHISSTALLEIAAILCLLLYSLSSRDGHCTASVGKTLCSTLVWLLYFAFLFFFPQSRVCALFILSCRDHICPGELSGGSWRAETVAIAFPSFPFSQVS